MGKEKLSIELFSILTLMERKWRMGKEKLSIDLFRR
jgi:hypothetical protein